MIAIRNPSEAYQEQMAERKALKRKLIKFQNKFGKKLGKAAFQKWKLDANSVHTEVGKKKS